MGLKLSYKQFFPSPFLQTERAEMQFTDLLTTIGSWPQDEKEYVLVSLVLLFCPDMLDLVERRRVGLSAQVCHATPEIPQQQALSRPRSGSISIHERNAIGDQVQGASRHHLQQQDQPGRPVTKMTKILTKKS